MSIDLTRFLAFHHPFVLLSDEERDRVIASARTETVAAGTHILRQGGRSSGCLFLLAEGTVRLLRDEQEVQVLDEGDCFGYPSILAQAAPAFDAVADDQAVLHCVPAEVFTGLLHNPAFAEFFLKSITERLQRVTRREVASLGGELTTTIGSLQPDPPLEVPPTATVGDVARAMRDRRVDVAIVADDPPGIITDHDFQTRVLAENLGPDTPASRVMTRPLKTLPEDAPAHEALLFMLEHRIHHLPVAGLGGIVGILSATDLLRHQTRNPLYLMRQLEHVDSPAALASYVRTVASMVERLFAGGLKVAQIGRICASLNDALARRVLRLAEDRLGPPPCPYAWLVFGSEGRREQVLINDMDNALAYAEESPEAAAYFPKLAAAAVQNLQAAGFPPCPGGYMATNWCRSLPEWERTLGDWIGKPDPENLMVASIFFDFRAVAGDLSVEPLERLVTTAHEQQVFMLHLARASLNWRPPLGLFRRIQADDGRVDVKTGGLAPLVSAARVYALASGSAARSTRERLDDAVQAGLLSQDLGATAVETYRYLLQMRLRAQLAALHAGGELDNRIDLGALSPRDRHLLKDAFGVIREVQGAVAQRFRTNA